MRYSEDVILNMFYTSEPGGDWENYELTNNPDFLPQVAEMYKAGNRDLIQVLNDYYPHWITAIEQFLQSKQGTSGNQQIQAKDYRKEWVLNTLIIGNPIEAVNSEPDFLPALAQMYMANDPDVLASFRDYYPELQPIVENYIREKAATSTVNVGKHGSEWVYNELYIAGHPAQTIQNDPDFLPALAALYKANDKDVVSAINQYYPEIKPTIENYIAQHPDRSSTNTNPYTLSIDSNGNAIVKETKLDPNAGSWSFDLNSGETITTNDYNDALIYEAVFTNIGKGPKDGYYSWTIAGKTYYNYTDAYNAYAEEFNNELARVSNYGNAATGGQFNNEAFINAQSEYVEPENEIKTLQLKTKDDTAAQTTTKKNNKMWWIIGGAVLALGIGVFAASRKNKKSKK